MNATEFAQLADRIEALWPGSTWVDERQALVVFEHFTNIGLEAALEAVDLAFNHGQEWPPKPSKLRQVASNVQARTLKHPELAEDTGPQEGVEGFARKHGGLSPSQVARQRAGLDPGIPAFPGFVEKQ